MSHRSYYNLDLTLLRLSKMRFRVLARSDQPDEGEATGIFVVPRRLVDDMYLAFELTTGQPPPRRRVEPQEIALTKTLGDALYRSLFSNGVGKLFERTVARARASGAGLRLRLRLRDAPELSNIPWETLYHQEENRFLGLSADFLIVRYLEQNVPIVPLRTHAPLRILGIIHAESDRDSEAETLQGIDVETEWASLLDAVKPLVDEGSLHIERLTRPTLSALQQKLRNSKQPFHIVHFIGHGAFDETRDEGVVEMSDDDGNAVTISGEELGRILDGNGVRLVFINACEGAKGSGQDSFSSVAQSLSQLGVPAVVAMLAAITDHAATTFAREFYRSLVEQNPVDISVCEGRRALQALRNPVEWAIPVCYTRSPDGRLFDLEVPSSPRHKSAPLATRPEEHPAQPAAVQIAVADIKAGVAATAYCAAKSSERGDILLGIKIDIAAGIMQMVSTDGYRLARWRRRVLDPKAPFAFSAVMPAERLATQLRKLRSGERVRIADDGGNDMHLITGSSAVLVRKLRGTFPVYEPVFPRVYQTDLSVSQRELLEAIDRLRGTHTTGTIKITAERGVIELTYSGQRKPKTATLYGVQEGPKAEVLLNSAFLHDVIQHMPGMVLLRHLSPTSPVLFTSREVAHDPEASYEVVVMPIRF